MEKTKVIFKKEYNPYTKSWDVFAVFPEFKASYGNLQCFTSEGWTECSYGYYATAKRQALMSMQIHLIILEKCLMVQMAMIL